MTRRIGTLLCAAMLWYGPVHAEDTEPNAADPRYRLTFVVEAGPMFEPTTETEAPSKIAGSGAFHLRLLPPLWLQLRIGFSGVESAYLVLSHSLALGPNENLLLHLGGGPAILPGVAEGRFGPDRNFHLQLGVRVGPRPSSNRQLTPVVTARGLATQWEFVTIERSPEWERRSSQWVRQVELHLGCELWFARWVRGSRGQLYAMVTLVVGRGFLISRSSSAPLGLHVGLGFQQSGVVMKRADQ